MEREEIDYIVDAMISLRPGAKFSINSTGYESLDWQDEMQSKPTQEEFLDSLNRVKINWKNKEYQRNRLVEYPDIGDQLDMLWHAMDQGNLPKNNDFYASILEVKTNHPKPINN